MARDFPIHLGETVEIGEAGEKLRVSAGETSVEVDKVLCAIGRTPNVEGLALENSGLELDARGIPLFDRNTMQCGDSHSFIAGDVNATRNWTWRPPPSARSNWRRWAAP